MTSSPKARDCGCGGATPRFATLRETQGKGATSVTDFEPLALMHARAARSRDDSDSTYFFDLMYLAEFTAKLLVLELLACIRDDRERLGYSLEYKLVRADGIGEWADVFDSLLAGPESQLLVIGARDSLTALGASQPCGADTWQRDAIDALNEVALLIDDGTEDLSKHKASLRKWMRQLVWLRNRTRGHGAPLPGRLAEAAPALERSLSCVIENAPAFQRSWAHIRRNLSSKYRVSSFGGPKEPFEYLKLETEHSHPDGCYLHLDGLRAVPLLWTDAELTDFYVPNGAFRGDRFESISYITDDTVQQEDDSYLLPASAEPASETTGRPELDIVGEVFSNMPGRRVGYVERIPLQDELTRLLSDDRHPVVTLQGRGGIGKTSLALHVLHDTAARGDHYAIVWFSARDIDLLPTGPKTVRPDVLTTSDIALDFARLMRPDEKLSGDSAIAHLSDCLSGAAPDGPYIFVIDNFETIRDPAPLYAFLSNAVRLPNKVLITTRTRDFKADYPIDVPGMSRPEFHELLVEVQDRLNIPAQLTDAQEDGIYTDSDGHPYIAKVLLGEMATTGKRESLKHLAASSDAMLDALFDRSFETLSPAAKRVFLTLCAWRSVVPEVGLRAVLMRPSNERIDVERALSELEKCSLVEVLRPDDASARFLTVPLAAALFGKRRLTTSVYKIAIDADLELIHRFGAIRTTDVAQGLRPRIERVVREAARRASEGSDIDDELAVVGYIASEYPPGWRLLSELLHELGEDDEAIKALRRYLEVEPADSDAWRSLIQLYRTSGDHMAELHARLQLSELPDSTTDELSSSVSRINGWLHRRDLDLDADEKRLTIRRLRALMESRYSELDATDMSRLAWLCMNDQDAVAAEKWARDGLAADETNAHCRRLVERLEAPA